MTMAAIGTYAEPARSGPDQQAADLAAKARGEPARPRGVLNTYRGDGPIAHRIGGVVQGQLPPLPPLLVGLLVTGDLAFLGFSNLPGVLIFGPVVAMLLAALGAGHPHDGRLDWLVPSLLLTGEGIFLAGGGTLLRGLPQLVTGHTGLGVSLAESPLTCVAIGSGLALDHFDQIATSDPHRR